MYSIQPHNRRSLITAQEVIKRATSSHTLDPLRVSNAIEVAETRFLFNMPGMGEFYTAMALQKNRAVDSSNLATLQAAFNTQHTGQQVPVLQVGMVVNASEFLSVDNLLLWETYLWKFAAEAVYTVALPASYAEFSSQGLLKNNPISSAIATEETKSVGVTLPELKFLLDNQLQQVLDPLRQAMHGFMCGATASYPLYTGCASCGDPEVISKNTSWITNVYEDEAPGCCG